MVTQIFLLGIHEAKMAKKDNVDLKLVSWSIDKLKPYARNPRKNDPAVERMARSIEEYGFTVPVLAKSDGTVIDGHLRLKGAARLGLEKIPVVIADHMTPAQVKAFRLMVNESTNWAKWDMPALRLEIDDLRLEGFDLDLTGFDGKFFADMDMALKVAGREIAALDVAGAAADRLDGPDFDAATIFDEPGRIDGHERGGPAPATLDDGGDGGDPLAPTGFSYPLHITIDSHVYAEWGVYKKSIGERNDSRAFLALFDAVRNVAK
jgi:hypothetical protein